MKLTVAVVLLVLGLASARTVEVEDPISDDLLDIDDFDSDDIDSDVFDIEINDDVSLDEARAKWRLLLNMYRVIEDMEKTHGGIHKRFIGSWFKKVKETIKKAVNKVGNFFKDTWAKAKAAFTKVAKKVDFKKVVNKLIPLIHSGMTVGACSKVCTGAAVAVLGPAAGSAGAACGPLCNGALAKLEDVAG